MSTFEIKDKVAIITGGASGLGLLYGIKLLEKGAKGVTLADITPEIGLKAVRDLETRFGKGKAIFVKTDVTDYEQFENAFKETLSKFKNIDILINNAGVMNDSIWKKEMDINVNGVVHGMLLGLEKYLPQYKSGPEGAIINISSTAGIAPFAFIPVYVGTKFAVHGMTLSWGQPLHYERTKVKVVGICPGATTTPLITDMSGRNLGPLYEDIRNKELEGSLLYQEPEQCATHAIEIIEKAPSSTMWVIEAGEPPYKFQMPDRFNIEKEFL